MSGVPRGIAAAAPGRPRCAYVIPRTGKTCRTFCLKGRQFCLHHDPEAQQLRAGRQIAAALGRTAQADRAAGPDQHLEEAAAPTTRAQVRDLLQGTIVGVLTGKVDARRGKVVQDMCRQLLPLLAPEVEPEPEEAKLSDEEMLIRLETEAARCRARIASRNGTKPKKPALVAEEESHVRSVEEGS